MGCMDKVWCPATFLHNLKDWGIEDPRGKPIEKSERSGMRLNRE